MALDTNQIIREAREELKQRVAQRDNTDKKIAELRILLRSLVRFMPDDKNKQQVVAEIANAKRRAPSLSDAIEGLLQKSHEGMKSTEIREQLEQSGFDLEEYSQPLGAIMTVLNRLCEGHNARVKKTVAKDKSVLFVWIGDRTLPSLA
jgi:hypothetical protein